MGMIIEQDRVRCEQIEQDLGDSSIAVTNGDGTDTECLKEAGINDADVLIAVTGHDQNNLVACQIAKDFFGVKRTVARVKNPKNIVAFRKMGVDSVISSTEEIANTIDEQLDWSDMRLLRYCMSEILRIAADRLRAEKRRSTMVSATCCERNLKHQWGNN